jgi:hypothetical protein
VADDGGIAVLKANFHHLNVYLLTCVVLAFSPLAQAQMSVNKIKGPYYPYWRTEWGKGAGLYDERSFDTGLGREGAVSQATIATLAGHAAIAFSGLETEVGYRATSAALDWISRQEFSLRENYYWPRFPWVQPGIGYFDIRQIQRVVNDDTDDWVVSMPRNTGVTLGLSTRFAPSPWKNHGPVFSGRLDYRTSLEAKRNFGYLQTGGVGYQIMGKNLRLTFEWQVTKDFYNAGRDLTTDTDRQVGLRYTAVVREGWVGVQYWPFKKG